MTPTHAAPAVASTRFRFRLAATCLVLLGLAVMQSPGQLVADTKFDLVLAPAEFLARATHLWDPLGAFGQLQNQAYGYLWPMGPFFLAGSVLDLPGWLVQRLWVALVMCVAMVGSARLARELGVRSDLACLVGGLAYALSPRMLTTLGPISIEAWPSALAPWVLLPLVIGSTRGSARRCAALSALAVAMVGGVNAAATFAVLPLGVLWLLTRTAGPRRRQLMTWWPLLTVVGTVWWLVPLFTMAAYSPPFLDYIEAASNTTFSATLFDALRGTAHWVPYVDGGWRAGNDLITQPWLVVNSAVVLLFGMAGLLRRDNPERLFLSLGVVGGLAMVSMGHLGDVQGWFAPSLHAALDGALAPLRNVHKFDPIVRLPLVLGLAWFVDGTVARLRQRPPGADRLSRAVERINQYAVVGAAVLAVVGAALPVVSGRLAPAGATLGVPDYWSEAAAYLHEQEGTALLLPGSSFGNYVWGSPRDEPFQALASSPWAIRNAVPLAPAGNIRMLDAVEARLMQGEGSPGLADFLRRAGVSHLVIRNDLKQASDVPDPVLVHQALADSPGLRLVASFGPELGGTGHLKESKLGRTLVDGGWQSTYPAIEVYGVSGPQPAATTSTTVPVVVGGPEDLLDLADLQVLDDEPTMLAADLTGADGALPYPEAPVVLTDGLRATERHFGRNHDGTSQTLAPVDPLRLSKETRDYLLDDTDRWSTTARYTGADAVTASSSLADVTTSGPVQRGALPFAAVDGEKDTAWVSGRGRSDAAWWQVDFVQPRRLVRVDVSAGEDEPEVVRLRTADAASAEVTIPPGRTRTIALDDPAATWLRVEDLSGRPGHSMRLTEVDVPGLTVTRRLVLPVLPGEWGAPDVVVLRSVTDARTGCAEVDGDVRCVEGKAIAGEETHGFGRVVEMPSARTYQPDLRVTPLPGPALRKRLLRQQPVQVRASSAAVPDARATALAAVDGDPGTTWTAELSDLNPVLTLTWLTQRSVRGLALGVDDSANARLPNELVLSWPGGRRTVEVDKFGRVDFRPIRTDRLTLQVKAADPANNLDGAAGSSPVPVGIGELRVLGVPFFPVGLSEDLVRYRCGSGPVVSVNGRETRTRVVARPVDLYAGRTLRAELCGGASLTLRAGENRVDVLASRVFAPTALVLTHGDLPVADVAPLSSGPVDRVERRIGAPGPGWLLTLRQNTNPGWVARQGDEMLDPVVVDGWQQGWVVADPELPVDARFEPDGIYRAGLLGGFAGLALLAGIALWGRRWSATRGPALRPSGAPALLLAVLAVACGGLLAGTPGAVVGAASFGVGVVVVRRAPDLAVTLVGALLLPAAAAYAWQPWGDRSGWAGTLSWPHYLVVAAVALPFAWLVRDRAPGRRGRLRSRFAGFSTRR